VSASSHNLDLYRKMFRIRRFEETVLANFPRGVFFGTTHTYLGQEADAVGVLDQILPGDVVFSNHRGHGHFLAYGGDPRTLFAELMGKSTGVCGGRGGSQHLHWNNFYSHGIQGGVVPVATGMALAEKLKGSGAVTIVFLGDGTLGEGVIYESFNMASLWELPVLYVLENNRIAQTTPIELAVAGEISARFNAFDIPTSELDTSDILEIYPAARDLTAEVREGRGPRALVVHTYRFGPHSKGDDTRPGEEIAQLYQERDPLKIHASRLDEAARRAIESDIDQEIASSFQQALDDPFPDPDSLFGSFDGYPHNRSIETGALNADRA
jgi:TPP-dependent pyruvate/acetoin dehydrogenase alpha subunit